MMNRVLFIDANITLSDKLSSYLSTEKIIIEQSDNILDDMSRILRSNLNKTAIREQG